MPNTRPQLGIGSLPQGKDNYRACLYFHTSVNISAEEVHEQGLAEVSRIEKLIKQVKYIVLATMRQKSMHTTYMTFFK